LSYGRNCGHIHFKPGQFVNEPPRPSTAHKLRP